MSTGEHSHTVPRSDASAVSALATFSLSPSRVPSVLACSSPLVSRSVLSTLTCRECFVLRWPSSPLDRSVYLVFRRLGEADT